MSEADCPTSSLGGLTVSVVMPVGGFDAYLADALEALAAQDYPQPWELLVSVNTDDEHQRRAIETLVERFELDQARLVDSSDTRSAAHARNVGATAATAPLLAFCDGDDIADSGWLSALVEALDVYDVVGGHLDEKLLEIEGQQHWRPPATPDGLPTFLGQPYLVSANMGLKRRHFQASGGFDTSLVRGEDIDFSWNLIESGLTLGYVGGAVIHYRHRKGVWPMMKQHYLYGRGFSQLLARRSVPGEGKRTGLAALKPNNQVVEKKTPVYYCRRGSIAAGRLVGLLQHTIASRLGRE